MVGTDVEHKTGEEVTETMETETDITESNESYPNFDSFENGTDSFDFHSLLKNLTAECDRKEEEDEFNKLAQQIEKLNINLTAAQIAEIIRDEKEMNEMINKIKELNIDELNIKNKEITLLLNRLTQLTLSEDEEESESNDASSHEDGDGDG